MVTALIIVALACVVALFIWSALTVEEPDHYED